MPENANLYDLLRELIRSHNWMTEQDQKDYMDLIDQAQSINLFGNLGDKIRTRGKGELNV